MIELINNPWTVAIGGGILSGLGVTIITRLFLEKKDDREILERVNAANKELIYAIRPCIAERGNMEIWEIWGQTRFVLYLNSAINRV